VIGLRRHAGARPSVRRSGGYPRRAVVALAVLHHIGPGIPSRRFTFALIDSTRRSVAFKLSTGGGPRLQWRAFLGARIWLEEGSATTGSNDQPSRPLTVSRLCRRWPSSPAPPWRAPRSSIARPPRPTATSPRQPGSRSCWQSALRPDPTCTRSISRRSAEIKQINTSADG